MDDLFLRHYFAFGCVSVRVAVSDTSISLVLTFLLSFFFLFSFSARLIDSYNNFQVYKDW